MNKAVITFFSKRSLQIVNLKRPSGQRQIYIATGKVCDLYYRGYHVSHLLDLWQAWLEIDKALRVLNKKCQYYLKLLGTTPKHTVTYQVLTLKFSNPVDSALIKLIHRYDVAMSLLDALVMTERWALQKANREARRLFVKIEGLLGGLINLDSNRTRFVGADEKTNYLLAKRSKAMPDHTQFGWSKVRKQPKK